MDQYSKIFKDLTHFTNLLLDFLYTLVPFLNYSLVERNFIVQKQDLLSAAQITQKLKVDAINETGLNRAYMQTL